VIPWPALALWLAACGGGGAGGGSPDAGPPVFSATLPTGGCIPGASFSAGGCSCGVSPAPTACADGCKNLQDDDDNCGVCGHACAGSSVCYGGQCRPEPTVIHPSRAGACRAMDVAVGDGSLFWADSAAQKIMRAPLGGGPAVTLAEDEFNAVWLTVRGANVYWVTGATPYVLRSAPTAGGAARTVVFPDAGLGGYTVSEDGQTIYFSAASSYSIAKIPAFAPDVAPVDVVETPRGTPESLAVEGSHLVFGAADTVYSTELVDGAVATCHGTDDFGNVFDVRCKTLGYRGQLPKIVVSQGRVYWGGPGAVSSQPIWPDALDQQGLLSAEVFSVSSFAVFGRAIFFGNFVDDPTRGSSVEQFALDPGHPHIRLARHLAVPTAMAADESHVYWATNECTIMAEAR
jgi:hypothetical protein